MLPTFTASVEPTRLTQSALTTAETKARKAAAAAKSAHALVANLERQLSEAKQKAAEAEQLLTTANKDLDQARFLSVGEPATLEDGVFSLLRVLHKHPNAPAEVKAAATVLQALVPPAALEERLTQPLAKEVSRRFSRFAVQSAAPAVDREAEQDDDNTDSSDHDDHEELAKEPTLQDAAGGERVPMEDAAVAERGLKRPADSTACAAASASQRQTCKGSGKGQSSSWADHATEKVQQRLEICRNDCVKALEASDYTSANALHGAMADLQKELATRQGTS